MIELTRNAVPRVLLAALLDDAALFPPRQAPLAEALAEHVARRNERHAYMQGPFVVSLSRLAELRRLAAGTSASLRLSVVFELAELAEGAELLRGADLAMVEIRLPSARVSLADLQPACERLSLVAAGRPIDVFFESAELRERPDESKRLADRLRSLNFDGIVRVGGKLRTGGVSKDALPASETVAHFVTAMHDAGLAWKATAGLHHPVRGSYDGRAMHGFLNLLGAACGASTGALTHAQLVELLDDEDPHAFSLTEDAFGWGSQCFTATDVGAVRQGALRSIGSCSFDEPVDGLLELGMLGLE